MSTRETKLSEKLPQNIYFKKPRSLLLLKLFRKSTVLKLERLPSLLMCAGFLAAVRAFHMSLGNFLATSRISSNFVRLKQLFAF